MEIRKIIVCALCALCGLTMDAQTAKQVLDKTASVVAAKQGAQASFTIKGSQVNTSGTIAIKGRKFHVTTPQATMWFDGRTQWTYVKQNDEVNVSNPTEAQLQSLNPLNFIYMYRQGYNATLTRSGQSYVVHLVATNKQKAISEMYITVNQHSYIPSQIRMKQSKGWTTVTISGFKPTALADATFRFSQKDFPTAEVIDLR